MRKADLTPEQLACVEFDKHQHLLIKGPPGTGKTLALLFRGQHLYEQTGIRPQFVTFTNALKKHAIDVSAEMRDRSSQGVTAQTVHGWCWRLMKDLGILRPTIKDNRRKELIRQEIAITRSRVGKASSRVLENPLDWWLDEFNWIKGTLLADGRLIREFTDYESVMRRGRGSALRAEARRIVWDIFESYEKHLDLIDAQQIDFDDYARKVVEYFCALTRTLDCRQMVVPERYQVDHILVDELQDLDQIQFLLLARCARKTVTVVADIGQKLYKAPFSYESVSLTFNNLNVKALTSNLRSTRQIDILTLPFRDTSEQNASLSQRDGSVPVLHLAANQKEEISLVAHLVTDEIRRHPGKTVALLARSWEALSPIQKLLSARQVAFQLLQRDSGSTRTPGVKLTTFHSAKGLDFDIVILMQVSEGIIPSAYHGDRDHEDETDFLASERRLLYVAMTRARHTLHMTCTEPRSRFLQEPYATAYDTVLPATPATVPTDAPEEEEEEMIYLDEFDDLLG
ncbi:MAG TPA: ATP-dependent helicase [Ktedonobacterales bacterium]|nr:ATP-dependent helicase [Ktedonobacterales bacterium]